MELKEKLTQEGLFDPSLKKALPLLPKGIGVVTSKTGAVIHDIARVTWRRFPGMPLYLFPVRVQGDGAAEEIAHALRAMDKLPEVDAIIVGRGGGSMEDLWAFNEECVARAIFGCKKPVVSAVGHETDYTIADMVADLRAPTPSAAAELTVPEKTALLDDIAALCDGLKSCFSQRLEQKGLQLKLLEQRLIALSPEHRSERLSARLAGLEMRIDLAAKAAMRQKENALDRVKLKIRSSGPMETLKRGYAVVMKEGAPVRSAASVQRGDALRIWMADGTIEAITQNVTPGSEMHETR